MDKLYGVGMVKGVPHSHAPKGYKTYKSWKRGYKAGKKARRLGISIACPYQLTDEIRVLLIKRDRWLRGYEEAAMRPVKKKKKRQRT